MEKADDILANMGISDGVPLSEAKQESVHAVGKTYDEVLPEVNDTQRMQFMQESMSSVKLENNVIQGNPTGADGRNFNNAWVLSKKDKKYFGEGNQGQTDTSSTPAPVSSDEEVLKGLKKKTKKPKPDSLDKMDADAAALGKKYAQKRGRFPKIVADSLQISKLDALNEMTAIGSLGVNMAGGCPDPEKPYDMKKKTKKKKSKKKKKTLSKFITDSFKGY